MDLSRPFMVPGASRMPDDTKRAAAEIDLRLAPSASPVRAIAYFYIRIIIPNDPTPIDPIQIRVQKSQTPSHETQGAVMRGFLAVIGGILLTGTPAACFSPSSAPSSQNDAAAGRGRGGRPPLPAPTGVDMYLQHACPTPLTPNGTPTHSSQSKRPDVGWRPPCNRCRDGSPLCSLGASSVQPAWQRRPLPSSSRPLPLGPRRRRSSGGRRC